MKRALLVVLLLCWGIPFVHADWQLEWSDEFNDPANTVPNPDRWNIIVDSPTNAPKAVFRTDRPENVSHDGEGNLRFQLRKEPWPPESPIKQYTSARIDTKDRYMVNGGLYEARIKICDSGVGQWDTFWLRNEEGDYSEIDIAEWLGKDPTRMLLNYHGKADSSSGLHQSPKYYSVPGGVIGKWHSYKLKHTHDELVWYVDDVEAHKVRRSDIEASSWKHWTADAPHKFILSFGGGQGASGSFDPSGNYPKTYLVDYVRHYVWTDEPIDEPPPDGSEDPTVTNEMLIQLEVNGIKESLQRIEGLL